MTWTDDLKSEARDVFTTTWNDRDGYVVPETDDVALKDGAVKLDATFLYADLASSSRLAAVCPWGTTAKIIRAYLRLSTRLIRAYGGHIRSFDGDRVMGVFKGDLQNTHASYCAREIDWCVENILSPEANAYPSVKNSGIRITHCVGIDVGSAVAVRAGIVGNNDLVWVGTPPSFAAKLSEKRDWPFSVYVSDRCYKQIADSGKILDGANIWVEETALLDGANHKVYKTRFMKTP